MEKRKKTKSIETEVYRGSIPYFLIYDVSEYELDIIEKAKDNRPLETWGYNILSAALSFFIAWSTCVFPTELLDLIFLCSWLIGVILSPVLIIISKREQKSMKTILEKIRSRKPKMLKQSDPLN